MAMSPRASQHHLSPNPLGTTSSPNLAASSCYSSSPRMSTRSFAPPAAVATDGSPRMSPAASPKLGNSLTLAAPSGGGAMSPSNRTGVPSAASLMSAKSCSPAMMTAFRNTPPPAVQVPSASPLQQPAQSFCSPRNNAMNPNASMLSPKSLPVPSLTLKPSGGSPPPGRGPMAPPQAVDIANIPHLNSFGIPHTESFASSTTGTNSARPLASQQSIGSSMHLSARTQQDNTANPPTSQRSLGHTDSITGEIIRKAVQQSQTSGLTSPINRSDTSGVLSPSMPIPLTTSEISATPRSPGGGYMGMLNSPHGGGQNRGIGMLGEHVTSKTTTPSVSPRSPGGNPSPRHGPPALVPISTTTGRTSDPCNSTVPGSPRTLGEKSISCPAMNKSAGRPIPKELEATIVIQEEVSGPPSPDQILIEGWLKKRVIRSSKQRCEENLHDRYFVLLQNGSLQYSKPERTAANSQCKTKVEVSNSLQVARAASSGAFTPRSAAVKEAAEAGVASLSLPKRTRKQGACAQFEKLDVDTMKPCPSPVAAEATSIDLKKCVLMPLGCERMLLNIAYMKCRMFLVASNEDEYLKWFAALKTACKIAPALSPNDFEMIKCLGKGGFGRVYKAKLRMSRSQKLYAVKVIGKGKLQSKADIDDVIREVDILQSLQHPYIVCLHCYFPTEDKLYSVLDFLGGGEFYNIMRTVLWPEEVARLHTAQLAMALSFLHSNDIIYRDLKPENVVLDCDGNAILTDFGLSIIGGDSKGQEIAGSPIYMPPEVLTGDRVKLTPAVDFWALGCMCFELVTRHHPFSRDVDDCGVSLEAAALDDPKLTKLAGDIKISGEFVDIVNQFLRKNPKERLSDLCSIQKHPWFSSFPWDDVYARKVKPTTSDGKVWQLPLSEDEAFEMPPEEGSGNEATSPKFNPVLLKAQGLTIPNFAWASDEIMFAKFDSD